MSKKSLNAWLQLFRAPNLFTVPGDPLAGYLIATALGLSPVALLPVGASLSFYGAGLLMNDLVDLDEDRRERPSRPLASGAIPHKSVRKVAGALAIVGSIFCISGGATAILVGFALFAAIVIYNFGGKRSPRFGPLNMGVCRGLSLLLGAAFGTQMDITVFTAAGALTFYIAAVTNLSRHETKSSSSKFAKWLPTLVLIAAVIAFQFDVRVNHLTFSSFFLLTILSSFSATVRALKNHPLPPIIGSFIRTLLFLQAAFCVGFNAVRHGLPAALLLLALWPISRIVGRRFYAS